MTQYTNEDASFDYEQLHGPICPRHGTDPCRCCRCCGAPEGGRHANYCDENDDEEIR